MGNERNSSVEILKIFAMILICICHANMTGIGTPTTDVQTFITHCLGAGGLIGDVIFIVCSSYFLLDSKKMKIGKVALMILNTFVISVIFASGFLIAGYKLSALEIVRQFFPTIFQNNWFITYYIVFYLLHPLLNRIIRCMDKKALGIAALLMFIQSFILVFVQAQTPGIHKLMCFVSTYFIVAYFKYYGNRFTESKKLNVIVLVTSIVLYFAMRIAVNFIGLRSYADRYCPLFALFHINNPIILAFSLSLLNLANRKSFVNKPINFISSLSLLFYLIHHNNLFDKFMIPKWHAWFLGEFGANLLIPDVILLTLILFVGGVLLSAIYKLTIERLTKLLANKIQILVDRLFERIKNRKTAISQ